MKRPSKNAGWFVFLAALASLGFLILHTFSMVVALDGYARKKPKQVVFVLGLHYVAALLVSMQRILLFGRSV